MRYVLDIEPKPQSRHRFGKKRAYEDRDIPFKNGYEILPVNQEYYFYKCLTKRRCCICGKPADICHVDTVGMGRNRHKMSHEGMRFYAGCREHHSEEHRIGTQNFLNKYQIKPQTLNEETRKRLGIGG